MLNTMYQDLQTMENVVNNLKNEQVMLRRAMKPVENVRIGIGYLQRVVVGLLVISLINLFCTDLQE